MAFEYRRHQALDEDLGDILSLIQHSFADMEGRIDPPSSMHRLTLQSIARQCEVGEVWSMGVPVAACVFLHPENDWLYISKLAVAKGQRGQGLASWLIELAVERARDLGLGALELDTRIELVENHAFFQRFGFSVIDERAHEGYTRSTYVRMRRVVESD